MIQDIKNFMYIHLYSHNYNTQEIHQYVMEERVKHVALSIEAFTRIFQYLWENYPESAATMTGTSPTTTTTTTSSAANSTVTTTTTSSGRPLPILDLSEHSEVVSLKELFDTVEPVRIFSFLKEIGLYNKI